MLILILFSQPDCVYVLSVMTTQESSIERGIPRERIVKVCSYNVFTDHIVDLVFIILIH